MVVVVSSAEFVLMPSATMKWGRGQSTKWWGYAIYSYQSNHDEIKFQATLTFNVWNFFLTYTDKRTMIDSWTLHYHLMEFNCEIDVINLLQVGLMLYFVARTRPRTYNETEKESYACIFLTNLTYMYSCMYKKQLQLWWP